MANINRMDGRCFCFVCLFCLQLVCIYEFQNYMISGLNWGERFSELHVTMPQNAYMFCALFPSTRGICSPECLGLAADISSFPPNVWHQAYPFYNPDKESCPSVLLLVLKARFVLFLDMLRCSTSCNWVDRYDAQNCLNGIWSWSFLSSELPGWKFSVSFKLIEKQTQILLEEKGLCISYIITVWTDLQDVLKTKGYVRSGF